MPENRYTYPKIDVFWTAILSLLVPTGNNVQALFLVHQVPRTSATVLRYRQMFTQFCLRVWVSEYTCHLMIANLLYSVTCSNNQFCRNCNYFNFETIQHCDGTMTASLETGPSREAFWELTENHAIPWCFCCFPTALLKNCVSQGILSLWNKPQS